jgi:uncharacterized membrane protein
MNQRALFAAAAATLLTSTLMAAGPAAAQDAGKEKCFGIVKAGQNDCANISGSHSCAGQSKDDMSKAEWKYVAKGTCKQMSGLTLEEAKAAMPKKG